MPDTTDDHHDQTTTAVRLPRHIYRKQLKLKKRRQRRQRPYETQASATDSQSPAATAPTALTTTNQDTELYLQQKAQWEAKEREYNLINAARKKVLETEKKARELAMEKWHANLRNLPIPSPPGYSSQGDSRALDIQQRSSSIIQKKFVSSGHMERRRTYRDKFELAKKSV